MELSPKMVAEAKRLRDVEQLDVFEARRRVIYQEHKRLLGEVRSLIGAERPREAILVLADILEDLI